MKPIGCLNWFRQIFVTFLEIWTVKITKVSIFIYSQSSSGGYYNQPGFAQDYNNQGYNQNYNQNYSNQGYGNQAYGNQQSHDSNYDDYYQQFDGRQSNKRQGYIY